MTILDFGRQVMIADSRLGQRTCAGVFRVVRLAACRRVVVVGYSSQPASDGLGGRDGPAGPGNAAVAFGCPPES